MTGWHIRLKKNTETGETLASWATHSSGVPWLKELLAQGKAERIHNGGGYPNKYLVKAEDILPIVSEDEGLDATIGPVLCSASMTVLPGTWDGGVKRDQVLIASCAPDEILLIVQWDLS